MKSQRLGRPSTRRKSGRGVFTLDSEFGLRGPVNTAVTVRLGTICAARRRRQGNRSDAVSSTSLLMRCRSGVGSARAANRAFMRISFPSCSSRASTCAFLVRRRAFRLARPLAAAPFLPTCTVGRRAIPRALKLRWSTRSADPLRANAALTESCHRGRSHETESAAPLRRQAMGSSRSTFLPSTPSAATAHAVISRCAW